MTRVGWAEAQKIGRADDPKHVYEVEWKRMFAGTTPNFEAVLDSQLTNPFNDMALESVAASCALRKVPFWMFVRAQMDTLRIVLNSAHAHFEVRHLEGMKVWKRYEDFRALQERRGAVEHSSATDMNTPWIRATVMAARDEESIARLMIDDRLAGGKYSRSDATKLVVPGPEWEMFLGSLKSRVKATESFGIHLTDTARRLATLEAACAVTQGYWPSLPDRISLRFPFTWDDIAALLQSLLQTNPSSLVKINSKLGLSWSPDVRNADQV